ncbi:MAG: hypothetical protein AB8B48_18965 [Pseudomonadales bacterium]
MISVYKEFESKIIQRLTTIGFKVLENRDCYLELRRDDGSRFSLEGERYNGPVGIMRFQLAGSEFEKSIGEAMDDHYDGKSPLKSFDNQMDFFCEFVVNSYTP